MVHVRPLKPALYGWQIFFIAISSVIGGGVFNHNGEALEIAGPSGMLVAMAVMGLVAVAVMEGVSELTQMFPAPNAIVQYVRAFVDKDLAWVVGIAYWYIYASIFATQNLAAAELVKYWDVSTKIRAGAFYGAAPIIIFWINYIGVWWYGLIESIGGFLKIVLVLGVSVTLFVIARNNNGIDEYSPSGAINDGFHSDTNYTQNIGTAMCWIIPVMAYGFVGVETVTIAAYEARFSHETGTKPSKWTSWLTFLEVPSRFIAYFAFALYMICTISETMMVHWRDKWLPIIYGGKVSNPADPEAPRIPSHSMVVIAMLNTNHKFLAGFFTACLVFSVLSAANTSLYVASRTMYGLARDVPESNNIMARIARSFSRVVPRTHTPALALIISTLSFIWLPFISLRDSQTGQNQQTSQVVFEIIAASASVSCMLVWATLCVAFIRYRKWIDKFKDDPDWPAIWKHRDDAYTAFTYFGWMQPIPAYLGLIGCFLVVVVASATWWDTPASASKVLSAFLAPLIFVLIFGALKLLNWLKVFNWEEARWVRLTNEAGTLQSVLLKLQRLRRDQGGVDAMDALFQQRLESTHTHLYGENEVNNGFNSHLNPASTPQISNAPFGNQHWAHQEVRPSGGLHDQDMQHVIELETMAPRYISELQQQTIYRDAEQQSYGQDIVRDGNDRQFTRKPVASLQRNKVSNEDHLRKSQSNVGATLPNYYRHDNGSHTVMEAPYDETQANQSYDDLYQTENARDKRKASSNSSSLSAFNVGGQYVQFSKSTATSRSQYPENNSSSTLRTKESGTNIYRLQGGDRGGEPSSYWTSSHQDAAAAAAGGLSQSTGATRRRLSTSDSASLE